MVQQERPTERLTVFCSRGVCVLLQGVDEFSFNSFPELKLTSLTGTLTG